MRFDIRWIAYGSTSVEAASREEAEAKLAENPEQYGIKGAEDVDICPDEGEDEAGEVE